MHAKLIDTRSVLAVVALLGAGLATAALPAVPSAAATPLPPRGVTEVVSVGADHHTTGGVAPTLSADGHYVLYTGHGLSDGKVLLRDRAAQTDTVLFSADEQHYGRSLDLSANSRYAFYFTDESESLPFGHHPRIHRYNIGTGSASLVPLPAAVQAADRWDILAMRSSTNGRYIVTSYAVTPDDQVADYGFGTYVTDLNTRQTTDLGIGMGPITPGPHATIATDISGDGRFVAFESTESHSPNDGNTHWDSYVMNWRTSDTTLVSHRPDGAATNDIANGGVLSDNGRYVTFHSQATDGVPGLPESHMRRVFQYDTQTGTTTVITVGDTYGTLCGASGTGRFIAFTSGAENFGFPTNPGGIGGRAQVYRYDSKNDGLHLVSHARRQAWGSKESVTEGTGTCAIAGNGQLVAFTSGARDLVTDPELVDGYLSDDVFVWTN